MQDRIFLTTNLEEESSAIDANIGSSYDVLIGTKGITSTTYCALLDRGELTVIITVIISYIAPLTKLEPEFQLRAFRKYKK